MKAISKKALREVLDFGSKVEIPFKRNRNDRYSTIYIKKCLDFNERYAIYYTVDDIFIIRYSYNEAYKEFSKNFSNIGIIQSEICRENPNFNPEDTEDWNEINRLALRRMRENRKESKKDYGVEVLTELLKKLENMSVEEWKEIEKDMNEKYKNIEES